MKSVLFVFSRIFFPVIFLLLASGILSSAKASSLVNAKDTITTSRPSASAPLSGNQAASATQVTIFDNKSFYLASDSATLQVDTGQTQNTVTVASMSAANTPTSGKRVVYFVSSATNTHHDGTAVYTAVTAMHTIQFTTINSIPSSGKIIITFPGSADTSASPSATTFALNGLTSGNAAANISYKLDGSATCTFTVSAPVITCASSGAIAAGTTITFLIGCADASTNETTCTTQSPRLINPTKTATGGQGAAASTADIWKIRLQTTDASSVEIDTSSAAIGTIDPVIVTATVDPTLTFTITGIANATAINTGNTTGCTNTESTNTGLDSSATNINLGIITSSTINIAAQRVNITTNGLGGYSLTATSSGHLINDATGYWIADSTTPAVMTAGAPWFGIHACGLDVASGTWATGATGGGAGAKYGWPTTTTSVTLASDTSGPIDNTITTGNGITSVEYASTVDARVPQGIYSSYITYVATPTF